MIVAGAGVSSPTVPAAVAGLLWCRARWSLGAAWGLTGLFWLFTLLAMFSIGMFLIPTALLLTLTVTLSRATGLPSPVPSMR